MSGGAANKIATGVAAQRAAAPARVDQVLVDVLSFRLDKPFRAAIRLIPTVDCVLARVRAGGIEGIGYAFAFGTDEAKALAAFVRLLGDRLVGRDAMAGEENWAALWRSLALIGQAGAGVSALAAVDIALWDWRGKALAAPLHRLLGTAREAIPAYGSGGSLDTSTEELCAEMAGHANAGLPAVKLKLGHGREGDRRRLAAVRQAIGPKTRLIVDGNQQWDAREAIAVAASLAEFDLWWLEEPVPAQAIAACAAVRAGSAVKIATGETNFTAAEHQALLAAGAADILMPNLQRVGGITPWRKVTAAAELAGVAVASHVYAEINVHLMCACANAITLEYVPWWPRLFIEPLDLAAGHARPPERAGLGVSLDPAVLARHTVT